MSQNTGRLSVTDQQVTRSDERDRDAALSTWRAWQQDRARPT